MASNEPLSQTRATDHPSMEGYTIIEKERHLGSFKKEEGGRRKKEEGRRRRKKGGKEGKNERKKEEEGG